MQVLSPIAKMGVGSLDLRCANVTCQLCYGCDGDALVESIRHEEMSKALGRGLSAETELMTETSESMGDGKPGPRISLQIPKQWTIRV